MRLVRDERMGHAPASAPPRPPATRTLQRQHAARNLGYRASTSQHADRTLIRVCLRARAPCGRLACPHPHLPAILSGAAPSSAVRTPRLSEGGPSARSRACPQSRREPARPAQGSRAPASAVRSGSPIRARLPRLGEGQRLARPARRPHARAQVKASRPQPHTRLPTAPPGAARPVRCPHLRARGCASCFRARLCYSLMAFSLSRARAYTFRAVFRSSSLMPSSGPCMPPTQSGCFCQVRSGPKLAPLVNSRA